MLRLVILLLLLSSHTYFSQTNPQLIIDTKGHAAPVTGLFFINSGQNLLSVSQDKTIRIWETGSQLLKRTLRINIGSDIIGSIYCASYNAENDLLAVGGYLAQKSKSEELGKIILIRISTAEIIDELHFHKNTINALHFSPNGNFLISGDSDGKLACWTRSGSTYKFKNAAEAHYQGVTCVSSAKNTVVSGGEDGSVKLWKITETGLSTAETSTLHTARISSVSITADGSYIATVGEAFRSRFFKPELIFNLLKNPDFHVEISTTVVSNQNTAANAIDVEQKNSSSILNALPPKITFISPTEYKSATDKQLVKVKVKIQSDKKVNEVKLFVNGVKYTTGKKPKTIGSEIIFRSVNEKSSDSLYLFDIQLSEKENSMVVYASNENGNSVSEEKIIELKKAKSENSEELLIKPNMYMVSVGVSKFIDANNNLDFADDDAREMTKLFKGQQCLLYNDVQVKELTDEQANRLNILDAFSWLERSVTNKDIAIIFIATLGFNQKEKFYILPYDGEYDKYRATCVDWSDFGEILKNLPCRTVLFLDACHSGQLGKNLYATRGTAESNTEAIRELATEESGIVILSASTDAEKSLESKAWGHGAFTYSILNAVNTKEGDLNKNNIIYLNELEYYIAENVKKLTEGQQYPTTQKPSTIIVST